MKKNEMKKNMKIALMAFVACMFLLGNVKAQTQREVITINANDFYTSPKHQNKWITKNISLPFEKKMGAFVAVSVVWYADDWVEGRDFLLLYFNQNDMPTRRVNLQTDGHTEQVKGKHVSELIFQVKDANSISFHTYSRSRLNSLEIHFFDPGPTLKPETLNLKPPISQFPNFPISTRSVCTCPQPPFQGRLDWCPDGTCPPDPTPEFVPDPTHVIIHHTAGTNVSSDWAAVVRSIWDFHVNTNGWDDVGYNWLVDPNGVLYEGRGDGRLGAHFCAQNGKTTGICVMGDFTSIQPQAAALNTLAEFLAWETCDENIDPLGTSLHSGSGLTLMNISGHRDGCSTSCPGDLFYPLLPNVRQATQENIETGCDSEPLATPTVLAITFVSYNKISLSWQDNSASETAYVIERSDNTDDNFGPIIQLPPNATAFSDNSVSPGITYFYRVRAKQSNAFSDYSNVAVAVTAPSSSNSRLLNGGMVLISPNPTSGQVTLSIENQWVGNASVAVFDAMGRCIIPPFYEVKQSEKQAIQLDLSSFPPGIFWVKIIQGKEMGMYKVVKR